MDAFVSRKRRRLSPPPSTVSSSQPALLPSEYKTQPKVESNDQVQEDESTDVKLAILASLHPDRPHPELLELLLDCNGSVEIVLQTLALSGGSHDHDPNDRRRKASSSAVIGKQSSLRLFSSKDAEVGYAKPLVKKGKTLHLYSADDIARHTPCSIVHNFLPPDLANDLLREILPETKSYGSIALKVFDNVVKSPHTACFYVDSLAERQQQKSEFLYNGSSLDDVREILPKMREVRSIVGDAVNEEIAKRIQDFYPDGKKLKYQSPKEWQPNAAFVNCYDGGAQSVGYHTDQLTYLGPRAIIGSLSLGVAREFRVRKIVAKEDDNDDDDNNNNNAAKNNGDTTAADASGQIAIHLPHNSLLVMHAEMQEEWKHSIAPARAIDPHPIAGNKRINITYRWYRDEFHPDFTPRCRCGVATVLKAVQKSKQTRGKYMWMCQVGGRPDDGKGCGFFEWAEFTDDGEPVWKKGVGQAKNLL